MPFIVDVTESVLEVLHQLYALNAANARQVVIGFLPDPQAAEHPAITHFGRLRPSRLLPDRSPSAPSQLALRKPGPSTEADFAAGRLHDLTQSWAGDVVPYPAPLVSRLLTIQDGDREVSAQATVRNIPWGLGPAVVVIEVRDGGGIVWDVQLPPSLVGPFAQAICDVAMDAINAVEEIR